MITKATCPTCGRGALQHAGFLYDPIEGRLLTRTHGEPPEMRQAYLPHVCHDQDILAFQEKITAVETALRAHPATNYDSADYEDARAEAQDLTAQIVELITEHSIEHECPKCGSVVGQTCRNLTQRKRGNDVPTAKPHKERLPDLTRAEIPEIEALREQLGQAQNRVTEIYQQLNAGEQIPKILTDLRNRRF